MERLIRTGLILLLAVPLWANCGNDNGNGNGCSGNGDTVGPVGPQGPSGNAGPQGNAGQNGKDGKDGLNAVDARPGAQLVGELAIRLIDTKRWQVQAFDSYHFDDSPGHDLVLDGSNAVYGMRLVLKLGSSHEERLIEAQDRKIAALEAALARERD